MKKILHYLSFIALITFISCGDDDKIVTTGVGPSGNPETTFNTNLNLPAGSYTIDPDTMEVDESIVLEDPGTGGTMPITPGQQMEGKINFSAPNGNIIGAGMRFGDNGPVNVVPINLPAGTNSGTLNVPFQVTDATCANLSKVCHDIKCYEFAVTSDGKISKANIRDVALMCGNCDEPSCKDLIDPPCPGAPGEGNFVIDGTSYTSAFTACTDALGNGKELITFQNDQSTAGAFAFCYLYNVSEGTQTLPKYLDGTFDPSTDPYILSSIDGLNSVARASASGTITRNGNQITFSATMFDILDETYSGSVSGSGTCDN